MLCMVSVLVSTVVAGSVMGTLVAVHVIGTEVAVSVIHAGFAAFLWCVLRAPLCCSFPYLFGSLCNRSAN